MRYVSAEGITAHHQGRDTASSHRTMAVTAFSERKGRCDLLSGTLGKLCPAPGPKRGWRRCEARSRMPRDMWHRMQGVIDYVAAGGAMAQDSHDHEAITGHGRAQDGRA